MKTTNAALFLVSLALSARPLLAAPVGSPASETSRNPANVLAKRSWVLNCTHGETERCMGNWGTFCDGSWVMSDDWWCYDHCRCYWQYDCGHLTGCRTGGPGEDEKGEGEGGGATEAVEAAVQPIDVETPQTK